MAEFNTEVANLNLFHEIFNLKPVRDESSNNVLLVNSCCRNASLNVNNHIGECDMNMKKSTQVQDDDKIKSSLKSTNNSEHVSVVLVQNCVNNDSHTEESSISSESIIKNELINGNNEAASCSSLKTSSPTSDLLSSIMTAHSTQDPDNPKNIDNQLDSTAAIENITSDTIVHSQDVGACDIVPIQADNNVINENSSKNISSENEAKSVHVEVKINNEKVNEKSKKEVTFQKDTPISGYLEPPDPWKNTPSWTNEEVILAYKKSCESYGIKPLNKLIQQLQTLNAPSKRREDLLSWQGEKLDQKQCESLEEVLKRVQFKHLDFEGCSLDDECAAALFDMIEYYESAAQLNIAFNKNIQARGWQACSRLVRRTPSLTYLDMRGCDLNERTIPIFGRALKLGCHLTVLHMENMNLSGRPLLILVTALKTNETLQELFLAENKLMPTDGVHLGNLLRFNHKLVLLDLRNNQLQDIGTGHISEGLMEQLKGSGLRTLVLWNNSINYQAMALLGTALAVSQNMETLNIGHNSITNEGVHLLKDGLLRVTSLLRLGLQGTKISDEGAVALAEYIADSTALLRIDLRDNDIKTGGLMALSHAMRVNMSVTRIDLDREPKKEAGMKDFAEQQGRLLKDILNYQQRNVQVALKKEEQGRAQLLQKVTVSQKEESEMPQQGVNILPADSNLESFAVIEEFPVSEAEVLKEEVLPNQVHSRQAEEDVKEDTAPNTLNEAEECNHLSGSEDDTPQQRPSLLFPNSRLQPQASLDSPVANSYSYLPTSAQSPLSATKCIPSLTVTAAPADMILSPQYFPKQIARKIFSVVRVSEEDLSDVELSTSPTQPSALMASFDPLCVSQVPLTPHPASSSTGSICAARLPYSSHVTNVFSPSSSLFEDLSEETVKHLVSPDIDIDTTTSENGINSRSSLAGILLSDEGTSTKTTSKNCANSKLLSSLQPAASSQCPYKHEDVIVAFQSTDCEEPLTDVYNNVENRKCEDKCFEEAVNVAWKLEKENSQPIMDESCPLSSGKWKLQSGIVDEMLPFREQEVGSDDPNHHDHSKGGSAAVYNGHLHETIIDKQQRETTEQQLDSPAVLVVTSCTDMCPVVTSGIGSRHSCGSNTSCALHSHTTITSSANNVQVPYSLFPSDSETLSSFLSDENNSDEQVSVIADNSSSSVMNGTADDLINPFLANHPVASQTYPIENQMDSLSSLEVLLSLEILDTNNRQSPITQSSCDPGCDLLEEAPEELVSLRSSFSDVENVELSLDEEPWLTVGMDIEGSEGEAPRKTLKQPDFFTTLSMNVLTQELASALTSLDGSPNSFEGENYD